MHQAYVKRELEQVQGGIYASQSSQSESEPAVLLAGAPVVVFINQDRIALPVYIRSTRGHAKQTWTFNIKPGDTIVFPTDFPSAPLFRPEERYRISWEKYNRVMNDTFWVSVETKGWEADRQLQHNGFYVFTRAVHH